MENTENIENAEQLNYETTTFDKMVAFSYIIMVILEYGLIILRTLIGLLLGTLIIQSNIVNGFIIGLFIYAVGLGPILKIAKSAAEQSIINKITETINKQKQDD